MVATYLLYQTALVGWGPALVEVPGNLFQMAAGTVAGVALFQIARFRYGIGQQGR